MQEYSLKNLQPSERRKLVLVGALITVAVGAIIVVALVNYLNYRHEAVLINNYPAEVSTKIKSNIEIQLRRTLAMNYELDKSVIRGEVREESLEVELTEEGIYNSKFLVDIEAYQLTFLVHASWVAAAQVEISDGVMISCPTYYETKYKESHCVSAYNSSDSIEMYLPYSGETADGQYFVVREKWYLDGNSYLEIAVDSCGDQKILRAAEAATREWIESINIDPEIFKYELPGHYCPGGAS